MLQISNCSFLGGIGALYITGMVVYKYFSGGTPAAVIHDHGLVHKLPLQLNLLFHPFILNFMCFAKHQR